MKDSNLQAFRAPGRSAQLPRPSPAASDAVRPPTPTFPCPGVVPGLLCTSETATDAGRRPRFRKAVAFSLVFGGRGEEEKKSLRRERTNLRRRQNASLLDAFFNIFLKKYHYLFNFFSFTKIKVFFFLDIVMMEIFGLVKER